jgi:hypothetical protein
MKYAYKVLDKRTNMYIADGCFFEEEKFLDYILENLPGRLLNEFELHNAIKRDSASDELLGGYNIDSIEELDNIKKENSYIEIRFIN